MDRENFYQYRERETQFRKQLGRLNGRVLRDVLLQIIEPEINIVVLVFEDAVFSVQGQIGGELLNVIEAPPPATESLGPRAWYQAFEPAAQFRGKAVAQVRAVGEAWNGHGLEVSFAKYQAHTLIITSIDSGNAPEGFNDCLKVGVADYSYEYRRDPQA